MLEDWRSARASSDGGSVALAGARSALVLLQDVDRTQRLVADGVVVPMLEQGANPVL